MTQVLLTSNLYLPNIGGIENSLYYLAKAGVQQQDEVTIISSNVVAGADPLTIDEEEIEGFRVKRYRMTKYPSKLKSVIEACRSALACYSTKAKTYDVVVARYHLSVVFLYLAGHRGIKYLVPGVVKYRNTYKNAWKQGKGTFVRYAANRLVQSIALRLCDETYVFSQLMHDQVKSVHPGAEPKFVLPGVDLKRYHHVPRERRDEQCRLLVVGRLVQDKGIDLAIKALVQLPPRFTLTLVGDGPDHGKLVALAEALGVSDRVAFVGRSNTPEQYYQSSDLFLMTSNYEPFGQTILEATACGLPVVAFDQNCVKTNTRVILGELGFFAEAYQPEPLAQQILAAAQSLEQDSSLPQRLMAYANANFSWDKLYKDLTNA
ncbi:glycosyltransferase family 4 protein [Ferrimonas balearica]|uniref:glycosyltransferase family 4 protein n=1 Tax=Ferrimonas balearica TaxID=44012 RepID=UPI001C9642F8|nr:glycosyltransferase [Ferrimonas balearica]MBY5978959.1 glycosyltransferase [Ferrimonas balearica]